MSAADQVGMGCGVAGVGLIVLSGALALGGILVCGGAGTRLWQSLPEVVEVAPARSVPGTPSAPEPVEPVESPAEPQPTRAPPNPSPVPDAGVDPEEDPEETSPLEVDAEERVVAQVTVRGDAESVVAIGADGTPILLPDGLLRGAYDLRATFAGMDPFAVGSIAIHDGTPRVVTCRASLAICKVSN